MCFLLFLSKTLHWQMVSDNKFEVLLGYVDQGLICDQSKNWLKLLIVGSQCGWY